MRTALALLLLLATPAWHPARAQAPARAAPTLATPAPASAAFDQPLAAAVFSTALAFIAPRALDPVTVQQLATWGLAAPSSVDPNLSTEIRDGTLVLLQSGRPVLDRPLPPADAPELWAGLMAQTLQAAAQLSPSLRDAGTQAIIGAVFDELLSHLDPYSRYVAPDDADVDRARRSGEAGIGVQLARTAGRTLVTAVIADSPAAEAGLHPGDRILAVDQQPTAGEELDTVLGWVAGLEGSTVTLTVRARNGRIRTVDIDRADVPPETVFATRLNDMLLLRISSFNNDTDQRLARELERNLAGVPGRAIRAIVFDLRGNRGGLLRRAIAATDLVLDHGIVAVTAGRNPQADHVWQAGAGDLASGRPIIVLVDGRSASAAEVMAAALADQGRAVVVGTATLGKGLVQAIANLPDGGELFVSWSRVLAPDGWPIQSLGILPQVCTSLGAETLSAQLQSLDRGVQPLAAALARHHAARAPLPSADALALRTACPAAEGRDADLLAARFLAAHPQAYAAARLTPPGSDAEARVPTAAIASPPSATTLATP